MGLYKRGNSKHYWISYTYNGKRYLKSTGTSDIKVAQKIEKALQAKIALGQWHPELDEEDNQPSKQYTFKDLVEKYLQWIDGRQASAEIKRYTINKHLSKFFPLLLDDIKLVTVEQLQTDLMKQGLKPASINKVLNIVRHMVRKAVEWRMCQNETYEDISKVKNLRVRGKDLGIYPFLRYRHF